MALSADGNTALIGAEFSDDAGANSGSAYVFRFDGVILIQDPGKLTASDAEPQDLFGTAVALSADATAAVIGAQSTDDNGMDSGSAYVFRFDGATWMEEQILLASDGAPGDCFGCYMGVAIAGDTVAIGAQRADVGGVADSGAVYVYDFDGSDWNQRPRLFASDGHANQSFEESISLSNDGTRLLVGASGRFDPSMDFGAAYIFDFDGTSWVEQAKLVASDAAAGHSFGQPPVLSGDGNIAVINAHGLDKSAYVMRFDGTNWVEEIKYVPSGTRASFGFGAAVSDDGEFALLGATADDEVGPNVGAAYLFDVLDIMVETPTGTDVVVEPADSSTAEVIAAITFAQVNSDGVTTMSSSDDGPGLPAGFQLGNPGTYYDIGTTATFSGSVEICIDYSDVNFSDEATLELLHFENDAWVNIRTSIDTVNKIICGSTDSLSPFAIVDTQTAVDPVALLLRLINDVSDSNIRNGIQNSLDAKLEAAFDALVDVLVHNNGAAINALGAFINAVEAQSGTQVPAGDAVALITDAEAIIALLKVQM